jgi:hypothetical protein
MILDEISLHLKATAADSSVQDIPYAVGHLLNKESRKFFAVCPDVVTLWQLYQSVWPMAL